MSFTVALPLFLIGKTRIPITVSFQILANLGLGNTLGFVILASFGTVVAL